MALISSILGKDFTQITCVAFLWIASDAISPAQDYERYQPKTAPAPAASAPSTEPPPKVEGSPKILVSKLTGIVFWDATSKVQVVAPKTAGVRTNGIKVLEDVTFSKITDKYLGQALSIRSINTLVKETILYYRDKDRPVADQATLQKR